MIACSFCLSTKSAILRVQYYCYWIEVYSEEYYTTSDSDTSDSFGNCSMILVVQSVPDRRVYVLESGASVLGIMSSKTVLIRGTGVLEY